MHVTLDSTFADIRKIPGGEKVYGPVLGDVLKAFGLMDNAAMGGGAAAMAESLLTGTPLHSMKSYTDGRLTDEMLVEMVRQLNDMQK